MTIFKSISLYESGYASIRRANGRQTNSKSILAFAHWVIENYVKPIENRVKVWNHGRQCTGEIGGADFLCNQLDLHWNDCVMDTGINGLIRRSQRDGAMKMIRLFRQNPDLIRFLEINGLEYKSPEESLEIKTK
jgi:hypothetical protein